MNVTNKENILSSSTTVDSKNILNRSMNVVSQEILDRIERGIRVEDIDDLIYLHKLPIFRYNTQITIHGLFPELGNNHIFGYKNVFQNKNKSIGIKWNAIDEQKRITLSEALKWKGFHYHRNSTKTCFTKVQYPEDKIEYTSIINELREISKAIDDSLYYGQKYIYSGNYMGRVVIVFELYVNAIYEKNIQKFLDCFGLSKDIVAAKEEEKKLERELREFEWQKERQKTKQVTEVELNRGKEELIKHGYEKLDAVNFAGTFIGITTDVLLHELVYNKYLIYAVKGKKLLRYVKKSFDTIEETINTELEIPIYSSNERTIREGSKFKNLWRKE